MNPNLLILGGSQQASALARLLAERGVKGTFSYAGRVRKLIEQPIPTRVGGFGGVSGLVTYLSQEKITHIVDATHPFASQMSRNAIEASKKTSIPLIALTRAAWKPGPGDNWQTVDDVAAAVRAIDGDAKRIFLAIGRLHIGAFAAQPQHFYLLRIIEAPRESIAFQNHSLVLDRGPFSLEQDLELLKKHEIDLVISKNSGGTASRAKIDAARALNIPVLMINRPFLPQRREVETPDAVLDWINHCDTNLGV